MKEKKRLFAPELLAWFDEYGRKNLPWQHKPTPYRVWISEIMLQQTQVATVIPYFNKFIAEYPDVASLAEATEDQVLSLWTGLGYYSRARNLHKASRQVVDELSGNFPCNFDDLLLLPGIGPSTAGAIIALACNGRGVILDGNVKRVLSRYHAVKGWSGVSGVQKELWKLADRHTPTYRVAEYTQAIMDLGATLCKRGQPDCKLCPLLNDCKACLSGKQSLYPETRPKKEIPLESMLLLVIEDERGHILLNKRVTKGIWQGLWCFPVISSVKDIEGVLSRYHLKAVNREMFAAFSHVLTHKKLVIEPWRIQVKMSFEVREMEAGEHVWYNREKQLPGGIPVPVRRILSALNN